MKLHDVNMDAIREGARALLASYPDDPTGPTSVPARVHQILWEDDWWRGATMMREACARAFQAEIDEVGSRSAGDREPVLAIVQMNRRHKAACRAVLDEARPTDSELDLDQDQIDVLSELWAQLERTGCIERLGPGAAGDDEAEFDALDEA